MKKCSNPEHPHCTVWVMPGDEACAHGHPQPQPEQPEAAPPDAPASSGDMLGALRAGRAGERAIRPQAPPAPPPQSTRPHLHVSGFDPRAAGGRQAIKLELRGLPPGLAPELAMLVQSDLILHGGENHAFTRTLDGDWRPVLVEFSSRGLEHGQHRIDVELHSRGDAGTRTWVCTLVILVPRPDASLTDIHQTFLSTHKNVRVVADDASIARVNAQAGGGLDIDVSAHDASIAQLNLEAPGGRQDLGFSTIAWDEDLIEIDVAAEAQGHPCPATSACLIGAGPDAGAPRHLRLFALDEFVLGRFESVEPEADLLLAHFGAGGEERGGLTRRLSGRHALIRRGRDGFEIEDVSRYGLLLDGTWPGKHVAVPLRLGMRIELTASVRDVVVLVVSALLPHGVILHRADAGAGAECFCLLEPERHPGQALPAHDAGPAAAAAALPLLFHRNGGFWHLDPATGKETALTPATALDRLPRFQRHARFAAGPYPETWIARVRAGDRRRANAAARTGEQLQRA